MCVSTVGFKKGMYYNYSVKNYSTLYLNYSAYYAHSYYTKLQMLATMQNYRLYYK